MSATEAAVTHPAGGSPPRVTVVGAGVVGLSAALRLVQAGFAVRVVAAASGEQTTSAVAAALWYPYLAHPAERVLAWGSATWMELARLATAETAAGIRLLAGRELLRSPTPDPSWAGTVRDFRRLRPQERPAGYPDGWAFVAPVVDMGRYLPWLTTALAAAGVTLTTRTLRTLDAAVEDAPADVVVDAAGLGARELTSDRALHGVRGQVVILEQVGLEEWVLDEDDPRFPTYVVPRGDTVVCGGTALDDETLEPDDATTADILARCRALVPALRPARVLGVRVGLRPARPAVRLEADTAGRLPVVHCYGHGGAGVTLSWGCADEVTALVGRLTA